MSKKPRKKGKHDRIDSNAEWLNTSLESTPLDLDALASMPIDSINADLKRYKKKSNASFITELNAKLPEGTAIKVPREAPTKKRQARKSPPTTAPRDRQPIRRSQGSSRRILTIRNALILSAVIIGLALLGPMSLNIINENAQEPAVITQTDTTDESSAPPTSLEFEFPDIKIRGVRYTLENFKGLVPRFSPLPSNPDTLDLTFTFTMTVNSNGNVIALQSDQIVEHPFEKSIMDSLFMWRFYGGEAADTTSGTIMITYKSDN